MGMHYIRNNPKTRHNMTYPVYDTCCILSTNGDQQAMIASTNHYTSMSGVQVRVPKLEPVVPCGFRDYGDR